MKYKNFEDVLQSFTGLELIKVRELIRAFRVTRFKRGEVLVKNGDFVQAIFFIESGVVGRFKVNSKNNLETISLYTDSESTSDIAEFYEKTVFFGIVKALTDGVALSISLEELEILYAESKEFERFGRLSNRIILLSLSQQAESLRTKSAGERYLELLSKKPLVGKKVSLSIIASYLGMNISTLSRLRAKQLR